MKLITKEWIEKAEGRMSSIKHVLFVLLLSFHVEAIIAEEGEEEPPVVLPEVVVEEPEETTYYGVEDATTATKTDTPIEEIPQSIEVINRDVIEDRGAVQLQDVIYNVSGAVPGGPLTQVPFLLRGFMAEILRNGLAQSRFLFLNIAQEELANVERIEVLKGPASVLYGNTAPGGIINIITKKPLPYFYASTEMTAGSFDFYHPALDISAPLTSDKNLLFRLNASYLNSDSFRDFISSERIFVAPVLSWKILPSMTLTLEGEYFDADQPLDEGLVAAGSGVADIPFSRNLGEPTDQKTEVERATANVTLETEISKNIFLRNILEYNRNTADRFDHVHVALLPDDRTVARTIVDANFESEVYTTQHDLTARVKTGSMEHRLLFGFEYIREDFDSPARFIPASPLDIFDPEYGNVELPDPQPPLFLNFVTELHSVGLYIQDQITVLENLHLLAGVRFDRFDQSLENSGDTVLGSFTTDKVDSQFSPRFGIVYEPFSGASLYASYSESFNLSLVTGIKADGLILEPQSSTQYEGGIKLLLWDGRLSSTASLYRIITENALTADPINGAVFSVQVDEERSQGFELDLTAEPIRGWNVIASYAYIDAEVRDDDFFEEGNKLPGVPKHSGSVWTTYKFYKGIFDGLGFGAGLIGVGHREGDLQNTFNLDSFLRLDAALYYDTQIRNIARVRAAINLKNITDKDYIQNSASRVNIIPGEPFTVLATLRLEF